MLPESFRQRPALLIAPGRFSRAAIAAAALMGAGGPSCTSTRDAPAAQGSVSEASGGTKAGSGITRGIEITPLPATTVTAGRDPPPAPVNARPDASPAAVKTPPVPAPPVPIYGAPPVQMPWEKRRPSKGKR